MKTILLILTISIALNANALEKRTYTKTNSSEAQVRIETVEKDATQVSNYADGRENAKFIEDMLNDHNSILYKLKLSIENENCKQNSSADKAWIEGCGQVTLTSEVRTSFGRAGWMSCGGSYTFFVGFTDEGSGRFFDVSHMVTISETAEAQTLKNGNYSGVIIKTLNLVKIKRIDEESPFQLKTSNF